MEAGTVLQNICENSDKSEFENLQRGEEVAAITCCTGSSSWDLCSV